MKEVSDTTANYQQTVEIYREIEEIAPFLLGEDRKDFKDFRKRFGDLLPGWMEYSFTPETNGMGIMTRGVGSDFEDEIIGYLRAWGIEEKAIRVFESVRKYFPDVNVLAKKDFYFDQEEPFDFTFYWQHLIPVTALVRLGARYGISKEVLSFLQEASLLMRSKSVFLGLDFQAPDRAAFRIFFANPLRKSSSYIAPAIAALMSKLGISADSINHFIGFHNFLFPVASGSVFTSLEFADRPLGAVKLDYEIIPFEHALQMMKALNYPREATDRIDEIMKILKMRRITYVGIKFAPGHKIGIKFYFDRRYSQKNLENPEILVDFLRNTIWTP